MVSSKKEMAFSLTCQSGLTGVLSALGQMFTSEVPDLKEHLDSLLRLHDRSRLASVEERLREAVEMNRELVTFLKLPNTWLPSQEVARHKEKLVLIAKAQQQGEAK